MTFIINNGRIVDPFNDFDGVRRIGVCNGVIIDPESNSDGDATSVIDADGCVVVPGLIDMHVHFREPGYEYKEDIATGSRSAAAGGFTTVLLMPNTNPAIDSLASVRNLNQRIAESSLIRSLISVCLTKGRQGDEVSPISELSRELNVVAVTDDGDCVQNYDVMKRAAILAREADIPIVDHCEDGNLCGAGVMRAGAVSKWMKVPGMPGETESNMVLRDVDLCRQTGARFHIQHISYHKSVDLVQQAQAEGLPVTAEASPHHLALTNEIVPIAGANSKMNPPLGDETDRQALVKAVAAGVIGTIATDHAPHSPSEKARDFVHAPFGIIGLETALPICITELYETGRLNLMQLISLFTVGPASVLGIPQSGLKIGAKAEFTIVDMTAQYPIDITKSFSKSRNSPFHKRTVLGKIIATFYDGSWVFQNSAFDRRIGEKSLSQERMTE